MTVFLVLFIVGTVVMIAVIFFDMLGSQAMPWACPRCHFDGDEDIAGNPHAWYRVEASDKVKCRSCKTWFKEHPNGSLVEDHDA